jgi:hypothetical protein
MDLTSHLRCKKGEKKHNRVSLARRSLNISWTITCPHSSASKSLYHFINSLCIHSIVTPALIVDSLNLAETVYEM